MARAMLLVLLLAGTAQAIPFNIITVYRDGDTRPPRIDSDFREKGWVARHAASGDIDKTCDGVCRVIACECEATSSDPEPLRMCGGSLDGCTVKMLEIPVGTARNWHHEVVTTTFACVASRPKVCASPTGQ
jgi:hypothetical protein